MARGRATLRVCLKSTPIIGVFLIVCSACGIIPAASTETIVPISTSTPTIRPTETASDNLGEIPPFTDPGSAIVIESPQDLETPTPLPPSVNMPLEKLVIYEPGPGSQVTSLFRLNGYGGPSYDDRVRIRLLGEGGTVLSQGWRYLYVLSGNPGIFTGTIPFNISHVAEEARLEISMQSWRDRQITHISTVNLTLLSTGSDLIHSTVRGAEKLAIFNPREETVVSGGSVLIQGAGWVDSDTLLYVDIINNRGDSLGSGQVELDAPAIGQLGTFSIEIPYQTPYQQWVHITIYEPSTGTIPGIIHLTSVEVWLIY